MNQAEIWEHHLALDRALALIGVAINRHSIIPNDGVHSYLFALAQERNLQARTALHEATTAVMQFANHLETNVPPALKVKDNGDIQRETEARAPDHGPSYPPPPSPARPLSQTQLVASPGRLVQVDQ